MGMGVVVVGGGREGREGVEGRSSNDSNSAEGFLEECGFAAAAKASLLPAEEGGSSTTGKENASSNAPGNSLVFTSDTETLPLPLVGLEAAAATAGKASIENASSKEAKSSAGATDAAGVVELCLTTGVEVEAEEGEADEMNSTSKLSGKSVF